jgi:hypothetical protein
MTLNMYRILTLNILAENFASPQYYLEGCDEYLAANYRWTRLRKFLLNIRDNYDIFVFQEVTHDTIIDNIIHPGNYNLLQEILFNFNGMFVAHDIAHWLIDSNSYLQNGNATFIHKSLNPVVFHDISLPTGNHCLLTQFNNCRLLNVHLDSDNANTRCSELSDILRCLTDDINKTDIICGDFNMIITDNMLGPFDFRVVSPMVTPTFAFGELMAGDLVLCRNGYCSYSDNLGKELWQRLLSDYNRLITCLKLWGTDHIPITATINKFNK